MPSTKQNPPTVFDHASLARNRERARTNFAAHNFLFAEVEKRLEERLEEINRDFSLPLHLGFPHQTRVGEGRPVKPDNPDNLALNPETHDLITSNLLLHWANDLPGQLIQMNRALKPDGLFVASLFGGETLYELKLSLLEAEVEISNKAMMRTSPMADVRDLGGLMMRSGFALPLVDLDRIKVNYKNMHSLMHDLRYMGEGNALKTRPKTLRRDVLARAEKIYKEKFPQPNGEGICATFDVVFLTGWSAHESQPRPLKPGSATVNMADVLGKKHKKPS